MADSSDNKGAKVVLLGDVGVGKTAIFTRFKTGTYREPEGGSMRTSKECECTKTLTVDGKQTTITLYDTAGMERHQGTIPPTYFRSAKAVVFVYSVANPESINNVESWTDSVCPQRLEYVGHSGNIISVLVGNKVDLELDREVDRTRGQNTADNFNADVFFEISALEGTNFDEFFEEIVRAIRKDSSDKEEVKPTVSLTATNRTSGSGAACCTKQ